MPSFTSHSVSALRTRLVLARVLVAGALIFISVAPSRGQISPEKLGHKTAQVHWRKYVNREYGFSFWYPDTYKPAHTNDWCKDNNYRRYLLCLERQDDPDASILVTVIIAEPFHVFPLGNGDALPARQRIGYHDFYCGVGGSMGVGFTDECLFNLRGKTLELNFIPSQTINSSDTTNAIVFKSLKTFRML
jgi:hypothetical protein